MQDIADAIYAEIDRLHKLAETMQGIWMRNVAERELNRDYSDKKNIERTNYQLSVELNGLTFRVRWHEVRFIKCGNKTIRLSKSLAVPESGKHTPAQFKKASAWEAQLIERIEDGLSEIRNQVKHLAKAHNSVVWASKKGRSPIKTTNIIDRVERSPQTIKAIKDSMKS